MCCYCCMQHIDFNSLLNVSMYGIDIPLCARYFQFIFWCLVFARFQCKHLHFFLERQLFRNTISTFLLLLLLLFLQSTRPWVPEGIKKHFFRISVNFLSESLLEVFLTYKLPEHQLRQVFAGQLYSMIHPLELSVFAALLMFLE